MTVVLPSGYGFLNILARRAFSGSRQRVVRQGSNNQIAAIAALIPSVGFMLLIERFLKADVLAKVGR
jgi:hypothetical protein